jgi:hypothetical protein
MLENKYSPVGGVGMGWREGITGLMEGQAKLDLKLRQSLETFKELLIK